MKKILYNKAVRDLIPNIIRAAGKECAVEQVSEEQYLELLQDKLAEEVAEYYAQPSLDELVDVLEVLMAVVNLSGHTMKELEEARQSKAEARGAFRDRLVLKYVLEEE